MSSRLSDVACSALGAINAARDQPDCDEFLSSVTRNFRRDRTRRARRSRGSTKIAKCDVAYTCNYV